MSFWRSAYSRSSSGRGLGIRELPNHPDGGYAPGTSAPKTGARSRTTTVLPHSTWNRLSVRRLKQRSESKGVDYERRYGTTKKSKQAPDQTRAPKLQHAPLFDRAVDAAAAIQCATAGRA